MRTQHEVDNDESLVEDELIEVTDKEYVDNFIKEHTLYNSSKLLFDWGVPKITSSKIDI